MPACRTAWRPGFGTLVHADSPALKGGHVSIGAHKAGACLLDREPAHLCWGQSDWGCICRGCNLQHLCPTAALMMDTTPHFTPGRTGQFGKKQGASHT